MGVDQAKQALYVSKVESSVVGWCNGLIWIQFLQASDVPENICVVCIDLIFCRDSHICNTNSADKVHYESSEFTKRLVYYPLIRGFFQRGNAEI
jgi:hypothetical protein